MAPTWGGTAGGSPGVRRGRCSQSPHTHRAEQSATIRQQLGNNVYNNLYNNLYNNPFFLRKTANLISRRKNYDQFFIL